MTKTQIAVVAGLALLLTACAGPDSVVRTTPSSASPAPEPPLAGVPGAYLGKVADSKVLLAVVPGERNTVRVYACDGEDLAHATVDQWFQGAFDATGQATLSAGVFKLTLRAPDGAGAAFSGEFFMGGKAFPFTASLPTDGSALLDAELRDPATGAIVRDGNVIVLGEEQRGAMVPTRPPKCRVVLVGGSGTGGYIVVCG